MAPGTAKVIDMDDFLSYGKKGNKFGDTLPKTRQVSCFLEIERRSVSNVNEFCV